MKSSRPFKSKRLGLLALGLLAVIFFVVVLILVLIPTNEIISEQEFEGVIFSSESAAETLQVMLVTERAKEAYWTPSKAQIVDLERRLDLYVQEQMPSLAPWLTTYKRQYFGFIRDDRHLIMVVGFCKPVNIDWRRELVTLPETAGCYFEAQYDALNDDILYLWEGAER